MSDLLSWQQFLEWAMNPAINVIAGFLWSFLVDYFPWFGGLTQKAKRIAFGLICLIIPLLAALLYWLSGFSELVWEPLLWNALQAGFIAGFVGTISQTRALSGKTWDERMVDVRNVLSSLEAKAHVRPLTESDAELTMKAATGK